MTPTPSRTRQIKASECSPWPIIAIGQLDARRLRRFARTPRRPPAVSRYRVFVTVVFCCVVLVDEWADRAISAHLSGEVVGPALVVVWTLTLLGAFGIGPLARVHAAMR